MDDFRKDEGAKKRLAGFHAWLVIGDRVWREYLLLYMLMLDLDLLRNPHFVSYVHGYIIYFLSSCTATIDIKMWLWEVTLEH